MNSCLIFGFGRSGTSMLGGMLSQSGYDTGENSYSPRSSNPLGFFEDARINNINERILEKYELNRGEHEMINHGKTYSPYKPRYGHRWLSFIHPDTVITNSDADVGRDIADLTGISIPFAYKDPRFSFTLNVWRDYLDVDVKYICMFREPSRVVNSVMKECVTADYLSDFYITENLVYTLWHNCYRNILSAFYPELKNQILFLSYDHFISGNMNKELSAFLNAEVASSFIDKKLNRSLPDQQSPPEIQRLYENLLKLSGITN